MKFIIDKILKLYQITDFSILDIVDDEFADQGGQIASLIGGTGLSDLNHVPGDHVGSPQVITNLILMKDIKLVNLLLLNDEIYPADGQFSIAVDRASGFRVGAGQLIQEFVGRQENNFIQKVGNSFAQSIHVSVLGKFIINEQILEGIPN